jgi:hypothetical protein
LPNTKLARKYDIVNLILILISFNFQFFQISDAHNPIVEWLPGQIMAQFFAIRGELTVLDA